VAGYAEPRKTVVSRLRPPVADYAEPRKTELETGYWMLVTGYWMLEKQG
jgi:hypothetical protein